MTTPERLRDLWRPAAEAITPDDALRQQRTLAVALNADGTISQEALTASLPWQRLDVFLAGAVTTGTGRGGTFDMPQGARVHRVALAARVAPSGGALVVRLTGDNDATVSLPDAANVAAHGVDLTVTAGGTLSIDLLATNGAEDVTVSLHYTMEA